MAFFDLPLDALRNYHAPDNPPDDFDPFWQQTLKEQEQYSLNPQYEQVDFGMRLVKTFDVSFSGFGGQEIKGWLLIPKGVQQPLPCVVEFIGYGGGRGYPYDWLKWSAAGFAHLIMDTRGQSGVWQHGDTPDSNPGNTNPQVPGFMTNGILSPVSYYYRRVFVDGVCAVRAAMSHPNINPENIAVTGISQGGGIAIAVAGLVPEVQAIMADVPFLCHFNRAVTLVDTLPYSEIVTFCKNQRDKKDQVFTTLSYFDGIHFAPKISIPALFSTGLMDTICPPSTVFAAYNALSSKNKEIIVWQFNEHEGGNTHQFLKKVQFLKNLWEV